MGRVLIGSIWALLPAVAFSQSGDEILGRWFTDDKGAQVEIYKETNGEGEARYFGKLVWFEAPVYEKGDPDEGQPVRDRENPDESKRDTPLMNYVILKDFSHTDDAEWSDGTIYDPEVGKTYKCTIKLVNDSALPGGKRLDVRGVRGRSRTGAYDGMDAGTGRLEESASGGGRVRLAEAHHAIPALRRYRSGARGDGVRGAVSPGQTGDASVRRGTVRRGARAGEFARGAANDPQSLF